mmetsp:Transcript_20653/g.63131  ORF Transcript_20653/g.63131 Transcript_20653/m.63131 type:complete len:82 (+) Transcript_20653:228-473(+)
MMALVRTREGSTSRARKLLRMTQCIAECHQGDSQAMRRNIESVSVFFKCTTSVGGKRLVRKAVRHNGNGALGSIWRVLFSS